MLHQYKVILCFMHTTLNALKNGSYIINGILEFILLKLLPFLLFLSLSS